MGKDIILRRKISIEDRNKIIGLKNSSLKKIITSILSHHLTHITPKDLHPIHNLNLKIYHKHHLMLNLEKGLTIVSITTEMIIGQE
jgi:hypothetical protein